MARFVLTSTHILNHVHLPAGSTIADTVGNSQAGDFVFPVTSMNVTNGMSPLDGAATTMRSQSKFANTPLQQVDGVNSIR